MCVSKSRVLEKKEDHMIVEVKRMHKKGKRLTLFKNNNGEIERMLLSNL